MSDSSDLSEAIGQLKEGQRNLEKRQNGTVCKLEKVESRINWLFVAVIATLLVGIMNLLIKTQSG